MKIEIEPIGFVKNSRKEIDDDYWGNVVSEIVLNDEFNEDSLKGIDTFSHAEIIFYFDKASKSEIISGKGHPRGNKSWPEVGIFAQRRKDRPNHLGHTIVRILKSEGNVLTVKGLDAIDNTPVLDIKPVIREFLPADEILQPEWVSELMQNYWM